jgi:hypothetical protein
MEQRFREGGRQAVPQLDSSKCLRMKNNLLEGAWIHLKLKKKKIQFLPSPTVAACDIVAAVVF